MPTTLIFKFRATLRFDPALPYLERYVRPAHYAREADRYFALSGTAPTLLRPASATASADEKALLSAWKRFNALLIKRSPKQPRYLFSWNDVDAPNRLFALAGSPADVPNLYNYFALVLPDSADPFALLRSLRAFVAPTSALGRPRPALLEFAYLTEPGTSSGPAFPKPGDVPNANQAYFPASLTSPSAQGQGVGLTIIEINGWFLEHSQFSWPSGPPTLIFPQAPQSKALLDSGHLINPRSLDNWPDHGTETLGILQARWHDTDALAPPTDRCRGLVPLATYRLASCLVKTSLNLVSKRLHAHENALLAALLASQPGDVVLVEVATGGQRFPLDVQPAALELCQFAHRRHITVVAAAGNQGVYLGEKDRPDAPLTLRRYVADNVLAGPRLAALPDEPAAEPSWIDTLKKVITRFWRDPLTDAYVKRYVLNPHGPLLVGSAVFDAGGARRKVASSWGGRVRLYAQGTDICTTTFDADAPDTSAFSSIGETSGASAILAGYAVSLQGLARAEGRIIPPDVLATLLAEGQPVANSDVPAVVPNYDAAVANLRQWLAA